MGEERTLARNVVARRHMLGSSLGFLDRWVK